MFKNLNSGQVQSILPFESMSITLSQGARLTDLHFQHHGEHHNVRLGEEHAHTCFHTQQIRRKLLADDTSDSDLLLSDDECYF